MRVAVRCLLSMAFALVLMAFGGCVLIVASASAEVVHDFKFSFDGHETPTGSYSSGTQALAVDQASGDVWVISSGAVYEFDAAGKYKGVEITGASVPQGSLGLESSSGVAVDNSGGPNNGDLYLSGTDNGVVYRFDSSGKLLSELNGSGTPAGSGDFRPYGDAVDASGDLYVADASNDVVDRFDASGNYIGQISSVYISSPGTIAVDSSGDVYLTNLDGSTVKLEPGGGGSVLDAGPTDGVGIDPANNHVYVWEQGPANQLAEYDPAGNRVSVFGQAQITESSTFGSPPEGFVFGIAVHRATGEVYVADYYGRRVDVFGPGVVVPDTTTEAASNVEPTKVTLNGILNPDGLPLTGCQFEYGTSTSYGQSVLCEQSPASIGSGTSPVPVSAELGNLQPDTTYHFRLVTSNANGPNRGADVTLTTTGPPSLDGEYATNVTSTSATLNANINPLWQANAQYRLEYGTSTAYGQTLSGSVGEGSSEMLVSHNFQELQPATTYHYRFVTTNIFGTAEGADHTFTTQLAGGQELTLPDGRVWELVSPADKKGAFIGVPAGTPYQTTQAADDGSAITYLAIGPHVGENPESNPFIGHVLSRRASDGGWGSEDLALPRRSLREGEEGASLLVGQTSEYDLFSQDLSLAAIEPTFDATPPLSPEATERTVYVRNNANGTFQPLVTPADVPPGTEFGGETGTGLGEYSGMWLIAETPDLSHIVLASPLALTSPALMQPAGCHGISCVTNLYEWSGGRLQLVNILPDGEPLRSNEEEESPLLAGKVFATSHQSAGSAPRAISSDGRWIAWTVDSPYIGHNSNYRGLYVRDMVAQKTIRVGGAQAVYQSMSADGSRVFFVEDGNLYEFDTGTDAQTDLTANHGAGESTGGVQEAVTDISEDGSYVYFVATSVLANGGVSGEDNLYLLQGGGDGWSTKYVTTLASQDESSWYKPAASADGGVHGVTETGLRLAGVSSRVSPNGRYLAFMSERSLTGYDNLDAVSGKPDEEVYLYDDVTNRVVCASCNPTGARPVGIADKGSLLVDPDGSWQFASVEIEQGELEKGEHTLAGNIPGWDEYGRESRYQPRYLSDSGRLFFNSPDALVAQDTNGVEDVYEYEPVGIGDCESGGGGFSERSRGCVGLISSGTSGSESAFYDASENGNDVFFVTSSRLVPEDYDTGADVYDAHVCTVSVPCASAPVSPPPCTSGDSCKPAPSPQPEIFGPAPSATFSGTGNVMEEAKKGVAKHKTKPKRHSKRKKKRKVAGKKAGRSRGGRASGRGGRR